MKSTVLLIFVFHIFLNHLAAQNAPDSIVEKWKQILGKWRIDTEETIRSLPEDLKKHFKSMEKKDRKKAHATMSKTIIEFKNEGSYEGVEFQIYRKGTWGLSTDGNWIFKVYDDGKESEEVIAEISATKLVLGGARQQIVFARAGEKDKLVYKTKNIPAKKIEPEVIIIENKKEK